MFYCFLGSVRMRSRILTPRATGISDLQISNIAWKFSFPGVEVRSVLCHPRGKQSKWQRLLLRKKVSSSDGIAWWRVLSRSDLLLFGSVTDVTINSDSIIKLIGPNSEDNHVNVDDLNTEHIFYPRSSSSSESPDSLSFTSANRVGWRRKQKQKPLKQTERGAAGGRRRHWFWERLFNKITLTAWSSAEKRLFISPL